MGVFTEKDKDGEQITKDWLLGLEIKGEVIYNVDMQIGVEYRYLAKMSLINFTCPFIWIKNLTFVKT